MRSLLLPAACAALLAACGPRPSSPTTQQPGQGTCADGIQNQGETGVDCGGPCAPCAVGNACEFPFDCASGVCDPATRTCAAPSCTDGIRNGDETGVDCGGATCAACASGVECTVAADCATGVCLDNACDCGDPTAVYVSATGGSDANPGTATAPLATIQKAVACAHKVPRDINVAKGTYEGNAGNPIMLLDGKSLVGGWSVDFTQQSPSDHLTEIRDTTDAAVVRGVAVYLAASSAATAIEGFTIQATTIGVGQSAIGAAALMISRPPAGVPGATVRNNVIRCGGSADMFRTACIDLGKSGGSVVIQGNDLHLGTASSTDGKSWGVRGEVDGASVQLVGNFFDGGSAATVTAIQTASATTAIIRNNVIVVPGGGTGIEDAARAEISNNTIAAATGTGILLDAAGAEIQNNAIQMSGGTCVAQANGAAPALFRNNDLFGCTTLYDDGSGTPVATLPGSGNLSADPKLDATYRPQSGSPLLGAGQNLWSTSFQTDKAGDSRPASGAWTIGAYENAATAP